MEIRVEGGMLIFTGVRFSSIPSLVLNNCVSQFSCVETEPTMDKWTVTFPLTEVLVPRYTAQIHQAKRRQSEMNTNTKGKKDRGFSGVKHKGNGDDKPDPTPPTPPNNGGSPASGVVRKFEVVEAIAA